MKLTKFIAITVVVAGLYGCYRTSARKPDPFEGFEKHNDHIESIVK